MPDEPMEKKTRDESIEAKIADAINGDSDALMELFEAYKNRLYFYIKSHLKNENDVEDVLQETFISALKAIGNLENPKAFTGWLYSIAYKRTIDLMRKNKKTPLPTGEIFEDYLEEIEEHNPEFLPSETVVNDETKAYIAELVSELSEVQKTAVILYYYEQMSISEIAQVMECSSGTVKSRLNYARNYIRAKIEDEQQKGNRVIVMIPLPFITNVLLWQAEQTLLPFQASEKIWKSIGTALALSEYTLPAKTSIKKAAAGKTLPAKVVAGVMALAATAAVVVYVTNTPKPDSNISQEPATAIESETITQAPEEEAVDITEKPATKEEYARFFYAFGEEYLLPLDEFVDAELIDYYQNGEYVLIPLFYNGAFTYTRITYDKALDIMAGLEPLAYSYRDNAELGEFRIISYEGQDSIAYTYQYTDIGGNHTLYHIYKNGGNSITNLNEGGGSQSSLLDQQEISYSEGLAAVAQTQSKYPPIGTWGTNDFQYLARLKNYIDGE